MSALEVWELSDRVVDLVADFDRIPWWAWLRRTRARSRLSQALADAEAMGMGECVRALVGDRL